MCSQVANDHWGSSFLSWLFCRRNKPPRVRYMHLALELQDDADWPHRPSTVTYASDPQSHISITSSDSNITNKYTNAQTPQQAVMFT